MNCDDITSILDDGTVDLLAPDDLLRVEAHLAGCPACAAECRAHRAVLAAAIPQVPGSLESRCRVRSDAHPGNNLRHAGIRPFVIGGLLLVGATAAAVLSVELLSNEEPDPGLPVLAAAMDAMEAGTDSSTNAEDTTAGADSDHEVSEITTENIVAVAPAADSGRYTVGVTPLRQTATDPEAVRRAEALYRAFTDALRAIPNLQLVEIERDPDEAQELPELSIQPVPGAVSVPSLTNVTTEPAGPEGRTLTLLDSRTLTTAANVPAPGPGNDDNNNAGQGLRFIPNALIGRVESITGEASVVSSETSNGESFSVDAMAGVVNVILDENISNIRVDLNYTTESSSADESLDYDFELDVTARQSNDQGLFGVYARSRTGPGLSSSTNFSLSDTNYLDEALQRLIEPLRQRLFPPDAERLEVTRLRVMDPALSTSERLLAFDELKRSDNQWNNGAVQDRVLYSLIDMAATSVDGNTRAWVLQSLQDVASPILVAPLANTLLNDADETVRLESAKALARHADDASARAALALAAGIDASAEVRLNARWASLDEAGRRDYVLGTLLDARLSASERLAPLLFQPDWNDGGIVDFTPGIDAEVTRQLTALLRQTDSIDDRTAVLTRLYPIVSASLVPLYLDRLRDDPSEQVRNAAAFGLRSQLDQPGVRFALEQAAAGDPSAEIRNAAAFVLANEE